MFLTSWNLKSFTVVLVALIAVYWGWRSWYLSTAGLRSLLFFRPCALLSREVLVAATKDRFEVLLLRFSLPSGSTTWGVDLSLGEHIKVRSNGLLPMARSYSPVAARSGEFDLIVKVYPPASGGKTPAHVSHHLSTLLLGDNAYISGPYPPPFQHMVRNVGRRVGIVAFGVGITEALGVAAGLPKSVDEVVLLWALRDHSELFAQQQLKDLMATWQQKLVVKYHFSRESGRRLDPPRLREVFPWTEGNIEEQRFLAIGTKPMMASAYTMLDQAGIPYHKLLTKSLGMRKSSDSPLE